MVPGRAESFDSFECAARAQGLPWLGPSSRSAVDAPPFERPVAAVGSGSLASSFVSALPRVRGRAALAGAAALAVAAGAASAYLWLRNGETSADARLAPGARLVESGPDAAPVPRSGDEGDEASGDATDSRPGREGGTPSEGRGAGPSRQDAARSGGRTDRPSASKADAGGDVSPVPDAPAPSRPPRRDPPRPAPPPPPPSPILVPPPAARPPAPVAPPAPAVATRPGWGYGDKKHAHLGPPGVAAGASAKAAKKPRRR